MGGNGIDVTDPTGPRVGGEDRSTQEGEAPPSPRRVVGVLADPDRPIEIAEAIADGLLPRLLAEEIDDGAVWEVHTCTRALAVGEDDMPEMLDAAARLRAREQWDWAVYITDLPIRSDGRPVLADVCVDRGVAALSLPGLVAATLAGAVGIGLQREQDVRNAAYGYRQREHRRGARDEGSQ